jgi:hypothetical protein
VETTRPKSSGKHGGIERPATSSSGVGVITQVQEFADILVRRSNSESKGYAATEFCWCVSEPVVQNPPTR